MSHLAPPFFDCLGTEPIGKKRNLSDCLHFPLYSWGLRRGRAARTPRRRTRDQLMLSVLLQRCGLGTRTVSADGIRAPRHD